MGANVSTNKQAMTQKLITSLTDNCRPTGQSAQEIKDVTLSFGGQAKCGTIAIENRSAVASSCNLDDAIQSLAEGAAGLTQAQKAGLGLNVSTNVQENASVIKNVIETSCGSSSSIAQNISGVKVTINDQASCDLLEFMNKSDAQAFCVSKVVADAMSKITDTAVQKQTGYDPTVSLIAIAVMLGMGVLVFAGTGKMMMAAGGLILIGIVLIVIGGVLWNKANKEKKSPKTGGILVGIGSFLLIVGIVLLIVSNKKKKAIASASTKSA